MLLKDEVLVVPTNEVNKVIELNQGFTPYTNKDIYSLWKDERFYVPKEEAENSIVVDQLMPFVVAKNEFNECFILTKKDKFYEDYNITKSNKNKRSLGISKHICKSEYAYQDQLFLAATDIIIQDIGVKNIIKAIRPKGFVKDFLERKNNHLGYVLVIDCYKKDISEIDEEYYKSSWMSKNELIDKYGQFDQWSKFIIDDMVDNDL